MTKNLLKFDKLFAKIWQIICENLTKILLKFENNLLNIDKLFAKIWQIICENLTKN